MSAARSFCRIASAPDVIMSAADWDLLDANVPTPKRDMVATDGQKLTLGDTTLTMYFTPGHTPGTISTLIPVKIEGGRISPPNGVGRDSTSPSRRTTRSLTGSRPTRVPRNFADAVAASGADVHIANHPNQDGAAEKLDALEKRKSGDPHPFVVGNATIKRYLTMVRECSEAGLATSR